MRNFTAILITGGAGFIGSNFIRVLLNNSQFSGRVVNLDALTYAGNPESLDDVAAAHGERYVFVKGDITDQTLVDGLFEEHRIDAVCHLAAESHVDRSIHGPAEFVRTNVNGTFSLLESARKAW
ncbi:MAG: GDP-mannose 4,6-dehydratase, partial [Bacteroidales bacterium]|nr:GDP-mannose 4,6-dehydratase [Bacteroidales bacterium]